MTSSPHSPPDPPDSPDSPIAQAAVATTRTVVRAGVRLYQRIMGDLILLLAFLGLLYFLIYFTINSNYARQVFNEVVNGQVFRGSIKWERITWGPWPSELHIQRPVLADSTGRPVIRVAEVDVSLNLLALTDGAIVGEDIIIDSPIVDFREVPVEDEWGNPTRALNIAAMFLPPQREPDPGYPGGPPRMSFRVAEIRNARYQMDLPSIHVDCRGVWIEDAFFELRANPAGAGPVSMDMGAHSLQVRDVTVTIPKTPGEVAASRRPAPEVWRWRPKGVVLRDYSWRDWSFRAESFRSRLGEDTVAVQGFALDLDEVAGVSLGGHLRVDTKDVGRHLSMFGLEGFAGPAVIDLRTAGELMSQSGGGTLEGPGLALPGGLSTGPWRLHVRHQNNRVDLQRVSVSAGGGQIEGHGFLDGERGRAHVELALDDVVPATTGLPPPAPTLVDVLDARFDGTVSASLVDLFGEAPSLAATTALSIIRGRDAALLPPETRVEATAIWQGQTIDVRHAALRTGTDDVEARGRVELDTERATGRISAVISEVAPYAGLAGLPLTGALTAEARVDGPWRRPEATAELRGRGLTWAHFPPADLDLRARLDDGRLAVDALDARSGGATLKVQGTADVLRPRRGVNATARLEGFEVATWIHAPPVFGLARAETTVRGTLSRPEVDLMLGVSGARYAEFPAADVELRAHAVGLKQPEVRIDALSVTAPIGRVAVRGHLSPLSPDAPLALTARVEALEVGDLPLPVDIGGRARAELSIDGSLRAPTVGGSVDVTAPRYRSLALAAVEFSGRWAPPWIKVDRLQATGDDATLLSDARVRRTRTGATAAGPGVPRPLLTIRDLSLEWPGLAFEGEFDVDRVPLGITRHFVAQPLPLEGALTAHLVGRGTPQRPAANGAVTLTDAAYDRFDIGDATLTVEAADERLRIDGRFFEDTIVAASLPTTPGQGPATFAVRFTDLAPERILRAVPVGDTSQPIPGAPAPAPPLGDLRARLTGTISGGLDLFAPPPLAPFVDLELTDLRVDDKRLSLVNIEPIRAAYRDRNLTVSRLGLQAAGQKLRAEGTLRAHEFLDAHVDGDLDLGLLQGFLSGTFSRVEGQATVDLSVRGPVLDPSAEGRVRLTRALLVPRSAVIGAELELIEPAELWVQSFTGPAPAPVAGSEGADAVGRRGAFVVTLPRSLPQPGGARENRLVLRRDDGRVVIDTLDVALENFLPARLDVRLDADNISLHVPDVVRATFDADALRFSMTDLLRPTRTDMFVGGRIYVQRATYTADIAPSSRLNQGLRDNLRGVSQTRTVSAFELYPILKRLDVDLQVDGDNDIFVRNNVSVVSLNLEIRPSIRLRGNLYGRADLDESRRLRIDGEIATLPDTSQIVYSGREFEVTNGQVDFGKGDFLDATLVARRSFRSCQSVSTTTTGAGGPSTDPGNGQKEELVTLELRYRLPTLDGTGVPSLQLSSDSGSSAIDVATLVLTGACASQLTAASSAQPALEAAFTPVLNLIEDPLKETLDIDLNLTPSGRGTLLVEADKALSTRLRLYSYAPVGTDEDATMPRRFGLEYQFNNFAFGDLSNQSIGLENNTTGQMILLLNLD
jgi:hypothetical protein